MTGHGKTLNHRQKGNGTRNIQISAYSSIHCKWFKFHLHTNPKPTNRYRLPSIPDAYTLSQYRPSFRICYFYHAFRICRSWRKDFRVWIICRVWHALRSLRGGGSWHCRFYFVFRLFLLSISWNRDGFRGLILPSFGGWCNYRHVYCRHRRRRRPPGGSDHFGECRRRHLRECIHHHHRRIGLLGWVFESASTSVSILIESDWQSNMIVASE
mmetsp:Transcript_8880/g.19510  ORF Transcript_8880/g.19510 Transcript_8880/m.19510 type:complete len:212 (+) Transcript_8880:333-968(+)